MLRYWKKNDLIEKRASATQKIGREPQDYLAVLQGQHGQNLVKILLDTVVWMKSGMLVPGRNKLKLSLNNNHHISNAFSPATLEIMEQVGTLLAL